MLLLWHYLKLSNVDEGGHVLHMDNTGVCINYNSLPECLFFPPRLGFIDQILDSDLHLHRNLVGDVFPVVDSLVLEEQQLFKSFNAH